MSLVVRELQNGNVWVWDWWWPGWGGDDRVGGVRWVVKRMGCGSVNGWVELGGVVVPVYVGGWMGGGAGLRLVRVKAGTPR